MGSEDGNTSLWRRWTGESGPFYKSCAVLGIDELWETPSERATSTEEKRDDEPTPPEIRFADGWLRFILRHAPMLLVVLATISLVGEQLGTYYSPLGTYLPLGDLFTSATPVYLLFSLLAVLWIAGLVRLFAAVGKESGQHLHRTITFFGTTAVLLLGVVMSLYLVRFDRLTDPRQHLTFRTGYFLFLLLTAHLVYDGLCLRSENLFSRLGTDTFTNDSYADFRQELRDALGDEVKVKKRTIAGREFGPVSVSRSTAFALLLVAPTVPLPILTIGLPSPPEAASYTTTVLLQVALVAALFQFGVLIRYFSKLLSSDHLSYQPFHPDERGGFRDLGRFATRVNAILLVGGGYVLFRFYTGGLRVLSGGSLETMLDFFQWTTSFVGPILVYAAIVVGWLYFSFWRMHRRMKRGREQKIEELQRQHRSRDDLSEREEQMKDIEVDWPVYEALQNAPVWPINRGSMMTIVAIDMTPMLLGLFA